MDRRSIRFRRRLRRVLIAGGLALTAGVTVLGLLAMVLSRAAPAWWRIYRPTEELRETATAVENAVVSTLYRQRSPDHAHTPDDRAPADGAPWGVALRDGDASAWLALRLPDWIDGHAPSPRWPGELSQPQVRFEEGLVRVGVLLRRESGERVLTASLRPRLDEHGALWFRLSWVSIGRMPIPAGLVLDRVQGLLAPFVEDDRAFARVLSGRAPATDEPVIRLEDGRLVRLIGVRVLDGRIEFECRTENRRGTD
jgi:hypothetical protein